jgi:hypothetical protein
MHFAVVSPNEVVMASRSFIEVADDAAHRIFPVRDTFWKRDIDKTKRLELFDAVAAALREISLDVARR